MWFGKESLQVFTTLGKNVKFKLRGIQLPNTSLSILWPKLSLRRKETILNFSSSYDVDLLSMLNYKRGFFEELFKQSLTQKLSYHLQVPLLAIHQDA